MNEFEPPRQETEEDRQAAYKELRKVATKLVYEHEQQQGESVEYEGVSIIMALGLVNPEYPDMTISLMRIIRDGKGKILCDLQDRLKEGGDIHDRTMRYAISADGVTRSDSTFKIWAKEYDGMSTTEINDRLALEALNSNIGAIAAFDAGIAVAPITAEEANGLTALLQTARPMQSPEQAA